MLKGYQKEAAVALILERVYLEEYETLPRETLRPLICQCIEADFEFMLSRDIMRPDGSDGERFYNTKRARECIVMTLAKKNRFAEEQIPDLITLVDDYMDFNRSYLELNGLSYHVDESLLPNR